MKRYSIEYIDVEKLLGARFNPQSRVKLDIKMKQIMKSMERDGFWVGEPIVLSSDGYVADGHRRLVASKLVGITQVPCIRDGRTLEEIWSTQGTGKKPLGSPDLLGAVCAGLPTESLPDTDAGRAVKRLVQEFGMDMAHYLYDNYRGVSVVEWSKMLTNYLRWSQHRTEDVIKWMVKTKSTVRDVRVAMETRFYTDTQMEEIIDKNLPMKVVRGVGGSKK